MSTIAAAAFSTLARDVMADPYPAYAHLRAGPPIIWSAAEDAWLLHRYDDVCAVLADPGFAVVELAQVIGDLSARAAKDTADLRGVLAEVPFLRNPPGHGAARQFLVAVLTAQPLSTHRPVIAAIADGLLRAAPRDVPWDAASRYADLLPPLVMGRLLGLEDEVVLSVMATVTEVTQTFDRGRSLRFYERVSGTVTAARRPFEEAVAARRRRPADDGLSRMIALSDQRFHVDDETLANRALFLLIAGAETTSALIGNAIAAVLDHADVAGAIEAAPTLADEAVEETLRYDGPVQQITRIATGPCVIAGRPVASGDRLILLTGAAHRDPLAYDRPDRFALAPRPRPALGFGAGLHFCVGASLARMEAQIALAALMAHGPRPLAAADRRWWPHRTLRRLESLPITLGARAPHLGTAPCR